jgi:hypothetical protein
MVLVARSRIVQVLVFPRPGKCRKRRLPETTSYTYSLQGPLAHSSSFFSRKLKEYILNSTPTASFKALVIVNATALKQIIHSSQRNTRIRTRPM